MKQNIIALLISTILVSLTIGYVDVKHQDEHFGNVLNQDYVLAIFHNPKKNSRLTQPLKNVLKALDDSNVVKDNKIVVELIDTVALPLFDSHYDLEGRNALRLFIRSQMVTMQDFDEGLEQLHRNSIPERNFVTIIEDFIVNQLNNISIEVLTIGQFRDLILSKRIIGLYSGSKDANFKKYFHVAQNNIDFNFAHTFDPQLKEAIYDELGQKEVPTGDMFGIIRHSGDLNELDDQMVLLTTDFNEKAFMEFVEFGMLDKLLNPEHGNDIFKHMIHKSTPLLLFVTENASDSWKFQVFKAAVKEFPRKLLYSYVDINSSYVGAYHQMFTLSDKMMSPESIVLLWFTPLRKIRAEQYNGDFSKQNIIDFVTKIIRENEKSWDAMRNHLYDYKAAGEKSEIATEEL